MHYFSSFWHVLHDITGYLHSIFIIYRLWRLNFFQLFLICIIKDPNLVEKRKKKLAKKKSWTLLISWSLSFPSRYTIFNVNCTLYFVHCTLYTVHCTLYTVHCKLYNVRCTLYTVHCTLYTVHCTLYTVYCTP